jgi:hypothetical protein
MKKKPTDQFSKRESKQRFEAALRGARSVGAKPMQDVPKNLKAQIKCRSLTPKL